MSRVLDRFSRLVTARPWITLLVLLLITVGLAAGATRRAPPVEGASVAFLPPGSAIATAVDELDEFFGESSDINLVTLVFRGDALTPGGLAQMDALLDEILAIPGAAALLAPTDPLIAPSLLIEAAAGLTPPRSRRRTSTPSQPSPRSAEHWPRWGGSTRTAPRSPLPASACSTPMTPGFTTLNGA